MKFSFEKFKKPDAPKEEANNTEALEVQEELTELEKQEQFDAECVEEAEKLGQNLEDLKAEIDAIGGPEKFKEFYETRSQYTGLSNADKELGRLSSESEKAGDMARSSRKLAIISAGLAALPMIVSKGENMSEKVADFAKTFEQFDVNSAFMGGYVALMSTGVVLGFVKLVKEKLKARRLEKQKKIEALKFKMTGTEVK